MRYGSGVALLSCCSPHQRRCLRSAPPPSFFLRISSFRPRPALRRARRRSTHRTGVSRSIRAGSSSKCASQRALPGLPVATPVAGGGGPLAGHHRRHCWTRAGPFQTPPRGMWRMDDTEDGGSFVARWLGHGLEACGGECFPLFSLRVLFLFELYHCPAGPAPFFWGGVVVVPFSVVVMGAGWRAEGRSERRREQHSKYYDK